MSLLFVHANDNLTIQGIVRKFFMSWGMHPEMMVISIGFNFMPISSIILNQNIIINKDI
jgi:hypothetical protein